MAVVQFRTIVVLVVFSVMFAASTATLQTVISQLDDDIKQLLSREEHAEPERPTPSTGKDDVISLDNEIDSIASPPEDIGMPSPPEDIGMPSPPEDIGMPSPMVEEKRESECSDRNARCKQYANVGHCKRSPAFMEKNCKKTCNKCPGSECTDSQPQNCKKWAGRGECENNPKWMLVNCRLSCNDCTAMAPTETASYEQLGLEAHNKYRKIHGVPSLSLDAKLTTDALAHAERIAGQQRMYHDHNRGRQGENLAYMCMSGTSVLEAQEATKMWYDEICRPGYYFHNPVFSSGTGHFTQVVWKGTTKMGMAMATSRKWGMLCTYVVARYTPPGNMMDHFSANVLEYAFNRNTCNAV